MDEEEGVTPALASALHHAYSCLLDFMFLIASTYSITLSFSPITHAANQRKDDTLQYYTIIHVKIFNMPHGLFEESLKMGPSL